MKIELLVTAEFLYKVEAESVEEAEKIVLNTPDPELNVTRTSFKFQEAKIDYLSQ